MSKERWRVNEGKKPDGAAGKRMVVELMNGSVCGREPVSSSCAAGWACDGSRWSIIGSPFDIRRFFLL